MCTNPGRKFQVTPNNIFPQTISARCNPYNIDIIGIRVEEIFCGFQFIICKTVCHGDVGENIIVIIEYTITITIIDHSIFLILR